MSRTAGVIAPPPLIFLAGLGFGLLADRLLGIPPMDISMPLRGGFGLTLGVSGAALIAAALGRFGKAGTPAEPWKPTTALTTSGVYRLTRNPMYVGMAILLAGLAVGLGSWGALFALPLVCLIIDRFVIVREERYLEDLFGDSYATYRNRVRRWL